jgi:hypothetical protein
MTVRGGGVSGFRLSGCGLGRHKGIQPLGFSCILFALNRKPLVSGST